jgi:hypothetical protein
MTLAIVGFTQVKARALKELKFEWLRGFRFLFSFLGVFEFYCIWNQFI